MIITDSYFHIASCDVDGEVRIVGPWVERFNRGTVEVCMNGVWGTVCNKKWENNAANEQVVCRQLSNTGTSYL